MKTKQDPLPDHLTYQVLIKELDRCKTTSFYTGEKEEGEFQMSHPGTNYKRFPIIVLTVQKLKKHFMKGGFPHVCAWPERLHKRGFFLKIKGVIEKTQNRDALLETVTFRAETVQLVSTSFSVKETFIVKDQNKEA